MRRALRHAVLLGLAIGAAPLAAQDTSRTAGTAAPSATAGADTAPPRDPHQLAQQAQYDFERFRRLHLPRFTGRNFRPGGRCPEPVGMWCYFYEEDEPAMPELPEAAQARAKLLATLDSLGRDNPADDWISGQRVRYLIESGRPQEALAVAESCRSFGWWCDGLAGLALHEMGRYVDAEARFAKVLDRLTPRERCRWTDLTPYLDEDTRRQYVRSLCGTPERAAFESRVWWFSRVRYGLQGNDSRTEHFSRLVYAEIMRESVNAHTTIWDEAARELMVRFGWERSWAQEGSGQMPPFELAVRPPGREDATMDPSLRVNVIGLEAKPAYRFIPPVDVLTSPASSDSIDWAVQLPPVVARYAPKYARRLLMLEHQQALFRRGDTALVVLAYDVTRVPGLGGARLDGALVLTPGTTPGGEATIRRDVPKKGTLTVRAPWGPLLMSAEIESEETSTLVRARYGIRPPFAVGARVSLSDLLFYTPFGEFPTTVEAVLPHALATQKVRADQPLGVYWEAYNTNPAGEKMTISLVVAPDDEERPGRVTRAARALRLSRETSPVSLTIEDMSARGARTSPRAVQLDISTLKPGDYLVQLEVDVAGQYVIRADRRITVVPR